MVCTLVYSTDGTIYGEAKIITNTDVHVIILYMYIYNIHTCTCMYGHILVLNAEYYIIYTVVFNYLIIF